MSTVKIDKNYVFNLDQNLAKTLDEALTLFNETRKGFKGDSDEQWQDAILDVRDGFRRYHETDGQPEWDEGAVEDIEETCKRLGKIFSGLWQ